MRHRRDAALSPSVFSTSRCCFWQVLVSLLKEEIFVMHVT